MEEKNSESSRAEKSFLLISINVNGVRVSRLTIRDQRVNPRALTPFMTPFIYDDLQAQTAASGRKSANTKCIPRRMLMPA